MRPLWSINGPYVLSALRDQLYHNIAAAMSGLNPEAAPKTAGQIRKKLDQMISKARKLLDEHQEVGFIRQKVPPMLMRLANEYVMWAQKHWPRYSDLLPWQGHDNTVQGEHILGDSLPCIVRSCRPEWDV